MPLIKNDLFSDAFFLSSVQSGQIHFISQQTEDRNIESTVQRSEAQGLVIWGGADMVNIKLMKCGGLYNALKITSAAEVYGVECMIGCTLEAKISVNAAVHLACAKQIITKIDLDGPVLCSEDPILGGAVFNEREITVSNDPGLDIHGIQGIRYLAD